MNDIALCSRLELCWDSWPCLTIMPTEKCPKPSTDNSNLPKYPGGNPLIMAVQNILGSLSNNDGDGDGYENVT